MNSRPSGVSKIELVTFDLPPGPNAPWIVNQRLSTKHAAVKITFSDGEVIYYDNGGFGGADGIFDASEIPNWAYEE